MELLNASFDIGEAPDALLAFKEMPQRVLFHAGSRLYRLTSLPQAGFAGNALLGSPWWCTQETFRGLVRTANRTRSSIVATARARLAVTRQWNPTMEWLVIIELKTPAYGWVGATRYQPADLDDRSVLLPGNANQVFIPGLAGNGTARGSDVAVIQYYGSIE